MIMYVGASRSEFVEPFRLALKAAVRGCHLPPADIASGSGVTLRTLQRWLKGPTAPTVAEWWKVLIACGYPPVACLLIAQSGRPDLIGTASQDYFDKLFQSLLAYVDKVEEDGQLPLDPRGANRDASLIYANWQETFRRRQKFLDEEYARYGDYPR